MPDKTLPQQAVLFSELQTADLIVDRLYQGSRRGNAGDDPLPLLLSVSNQGGFRYRGSLERTELLVLTSTLADPDWPDFLDLETGVFTYFGDNKKPGRLLHETPRNGNELLRRIFGLSHEGPESRAKVPPILIFAATGVWRDLKFLGLAVPGTADSRASEDLVAIWKNSRGKRFQNYRAHFTVLDVPVVSRAWLRDIFAGQPHSGNAPTAWRRWAETGKPSALQSRRSLEYRTKSEQLPSDASGLRVIRTLQQYFRENPYLFEECAASIAVMMFPDIAAIDVTRPSRDGGRDALGKMRIGKGPASILVDFALEAKCFSLNASVGVRELSRLISRLRHRQFGVLVTTSYLDLQAYKELKEDGHPIVVISAIDIVELLRNNGMADDKTLLAWLSRDFPIA